LIDATDAGTLIQFVLKIIRLLLLKESSSHEGVGITLGNPAHHLTDKIKRGRERGIGRIRRRYGYSPLLRHRFLEGATLSDDMEDLWCKARHDGPTPETIDERGIEEGGKREC
jgi:hypothetical protein